MNIGEAAKKSGLSVKTVRYYDEINLIKPIKNKATNYRHYTTADLAKLQFIGKPVVLILVLKNAKNCCHYTKIKTEVAKRFEISLLRKLLKST
jgi:hypothetical protein